MNDINGSAGISLGDAYRNAPEGSVEKRMLGNLIGALDAALKSEEIKAPSLPKRIKTFIGRLLPITE